MTAPNDDGCGGGGEGEGGEGDDMCKTTMPPPSVHTNGNSCSTIETDDTGGISSSSKNTIRGASNGSSKNNYSNNSNSTCNNSAGGVIGDGAANDSVNGGIANGGSYIKASLSMTSLPPDEKRECREVIKAKLRIERPYNSLKKKCNTDKDNWRHSWGSGYSHSSCSLHSNAASGLFGIGCGKDEFWDALQTNYNYIMDTNLLDTCKEARCEIEGAASVLTIPGENCFKMLSTSRPEGSFEDPKHLRKWLREMEVKLDNAPSLSEATLLSISELKSRLAAHSVLHCEIVSHARVVAACVRAAEKKNNNNSSTEQQNQDQQQNSFSSVGDKSADSLVETVNTTDGEKVSTATDSKIDEKNTDGNLKLLEHRYHLLYLRAIEVQCLFEGLLGKKESILSRDTSSCSQESDEEPASKHARLSDFELESGVTDNSSSFHHLHKNYQKKQLANEKCVESIQKKGADCDDSYDEAEDEDEVDHHHPYHHYQQHQQPQRNTNHRAFPKLTFGSGLLTSGERGNNKFGNYFTTSTTTTLTDFEADSEGSDCEVVKQLYRHRKINNNKQDSKFTIAAGGVYCMRQQSAALSSPLSAIQTCTRENIDEAAAIRFELHHFQHAVVPFSYCTNTIHHSTTINNYYPEFQTHPTNSASVMSFCATTTTSTTTTTTTTITTTTTAATAAALTATTITTKNSVFNHEPLPTSITTIKPTAEAFGTATASSTPSMQPKLTVKTNFDEQQQSSMMIQDQKFQKIQFSDTSQYHNTKMAVATKAMTTTMSLKNQNSNEASLKEINGGVTGGLSSTGYGMVAVAGATGATAVAVGGGVVRKRQRHVDVSKFNRSNRSSKNCATFYFKHLDTDNETNFGEMSSSHGSDVLKSADASSDYDDDDEEWLYTNTTSVVKDDDNHCLSSSVDEIQLATTTTTTPTTKSLAAVENCISVEHNYQIQRNHHHHQQQQEEEEPQQQQPMQLHTVSQSNDDSDKENKSAAIAISLAIEGTTSVALGKIAHHHQNSSSSSSLSSSQFAATEIQMNSSTVSNHSNGSGGSSATHPRFKHRSVMDLQISNNNGITKVREHGHQQRDTVDNVRYRSQTDVGHEYVGTNHTNSLSRRLPPRSPNKQLQISPTFSTKGISHESIKQLVLEAEHLVRDEASNKTPPKKQHYMVKISSTVKKREVIMPGPVNQKVQEWLEHQPVKTLDNLHVPVATTDCEASGEASETDSMPPVSDSSEGLTDSIATCMQTGSNSYGNSTELICGSAEPISYVGTCGGGGGSNHSLNAASTKVVRRQQHNRRKADRPWSVSCLSQLTESTANAQRQTNASNVQAGLASHSISESALDSLSPGRQRKSSSAAGAVTRTTVKQQQTVKSSDSKGSLKRRKTRKKKQHNGAGSSGATLSGVTTCSKRSDSGSENGIPEVSCPATNSLTTTPVDVVPRLLMKSCETMSSSAIQEITAALLNLQKSTEQQSDKSEEEQNLMKPNFRVGSYTTAYMKNASRLGSLAALATYMNDEEQQGGAATPVPQVHRRREYNTGTEDHHSSFSETAWDNYQEKYNSENYSEGFDSDAARRLMEFGDDYRNFIDSQSDCCSSLSAANNLDSFSPPRMDSLQQNDVTKVITHETIVSSVDHARRRRALELEYERRRKNLEVRRKSCQAETAEHPKPRSPSDSLSASATALTPRNIDKFTCQQNKQELTNRKLDFGMNNSSQNLRRTSESDTSSRRRKVDERRRSSRNLEKSIKLIPATSSSSSDDTDDEKEMRNLLTQSRNRLEDTKSLKIRCHLLRPEDYAEIIATCRDNIRCLESVLRGPPSTVLSAQCMNQTKDLLSSWDDLLGWSENASAARKMQEELIVLKNALNRLGNKSAHELLDTEPSIQIAIEALKTEKSQLQTYRTSMLRLNASVHSWLTRQERKLQAALVEQQQQQQQQQLQIQQQQHQQLKEEAFIQSRELFVVDQIVRDQQAKDHEELEEEEQEEETLKWHEQQQPIATITDNNGNEVQVTTSSAAAAGDIITVDEEKASQINTIVHSESEFHKHLKDEVSDMYRAWDEADARINSQLEVLTTSLIAWRQLEYGLSEFHLALGKDRGTLKGLEGALDKGQATSVELAQNVKLVAKLLSEKVDVSQEQLVAMQEHLDPNRVLHIAQFTASNGSLSDSGISDGGTTSDGGLSERERRLGVLRRLAKQLESALAPGSEAMKSIAARMESAESELKNLQNTCRDLIVRTAATHTHLKAQTDVMKNGGDNSIIMVAPVSSSSSKQANSQLKRRNRRADGGSRKNSSESDSASDRKSCTAPDSGDPDGDDPNDELELDSSTDDDKAKRPKSGWAWRIARIAVPIQLALITFLCVACLMQPNCCDNLNNLSMSFTPQLRYVRGPPPI